MPQASDVRSPSIARQHAALPFACSWEIGGSGAAWVGVAGALDLATAPEFRQVLGDARRDARLIVLDLRELSFIDSSGVYVILDAACEARRNGGQLLIVRGPAPVDRVLTLTEVGKQVMMFDLAPSEPVPAPANVLPPGVTL
jgi:anti-sigma B factor antagonist